MIVQTSPPGPVAHIESPVTVGGTVVDVYQFVTWVDDPGISGTQDLKRVTVVVEYHNVAIKATDHILRESMLFTPGTVTLRRRRARTTTTHHGTDAPRRPRRFRPAAADRSACPAVAATRSGSLRRRR